MILLVYLTFSSKILFLYTLRLPLYYIGKYIQVLLWLLLVSNVAWLIKWRHLPPLSIHLVRILQLCLGRSTLNPLCLTCILLYRPKFLRLTLLCFHQNRLLIWTPFSSQVLHLNCEPITFVKCILALTLGRRIRLEM